MKRYKKEQNAPLNQNAPLELLAENELLFSYSDIFYLLGNIKELAEYPMDLNLYEDGTCEVLIGNSKYEVTHQ